MAGEASPRSTGGCRMPNALKLVDVDSDRLEEVLRRAEQSLDEKDVELIRAVFESYAYVTDLVEDKNTTIRRLRQLFFGSRTETTEAVVGPRTGASQVKASPDAAAEIESVASELSVTLRRVGEAGGGTLLGVALERLRGAREERSD